jgi:uncharacterized coiled-coil DUF342 family protein
MSERNKTIENINDYKEEIIDKLGEYKQYQDDMQRQVKTDLEEAGDVKSQVLDF